MRDIATGAAGGRVWFVTGATSGFGRAIVEAAAAAGDVVVAAARRPQMLDDLAAERPGQVDAIGLDVTDTEAARHAVQAAVARHARIDVLVNNAGRGLVGAAEETTEDELRDLMELHFFGPVALTRAALPYMRAQGAGAIVQMSSQGGRLSFPGVGGYSATKFALEGWSEALAGEIAPFGIRVLIVEPGAFRTGFNAPGSLQSSTASTIYTEQVQPVRSALAEGDGRQPGDPAKAAAAILSALESPAPPLRLALGNDAADAVAASLDREQAEFAAWETTSRSTDFAGS